MELLIGVRITIIIIILAFWPICDPAPKKAEHRVRFLSSAIINAEDWGLPIQARVEVCLYNKSLDTKGNGGVEWFQ